MRFILLLPLLFMIISCNTPKKETVQKHKYTNELINETSPYLLQHAHNPVDWRAWNEETLAKAKKENKLMIISIGYAACHWCHVMEHESFEDSTVAAVMNADFISVKVDREERPDVDQIYINAVQLMTGSAGWPLNVIALPDGRPVYGGTYFKKEAWKDVLTQVQQAYNTEPEKLEEYATQLEEGIKSMDVIEVNTGDIDFSNYPTKELITKWQQNFDPEFGGPNRAPKFMMPNNYQYLLRHAIQNNDTVLLNQVKLTLDKMAYGGVYDHVGGGFSRYSVDKKWHIPHFEKMLYDNAQLVSLYSDAYLATNEPLYKEVVEETLAFINRDLTNKEGAFYSSLDADSKTESGELEEGAFYVFTENEIQNLLKEDLELFKAYYNINEFGLWEDGNYVLIRAKSDDEITEAFSIPDEALQQKKKKWKQLLLAYRNKRPAPRLDDKTLTSWNGLMLKGYVDAFKAFGEEDYLTTALKNATFIKEKQLQDNGALYHTYKDGKSTLNGYLEDYAAVIEAFIALYEVTLDEQWIHSAKALTDYSFENFFDSEKHMFYFTSKEDTALVTRTIEYRDNVIPASNSMMAKNLFKLSHHFDSPTYDKTAHQMLKNVTTEMEQYPAGFSNWLDLLANYQFKYFEIVVVGQDASDKIKELNKNYIPNKLIAGSVKKSDAYLLEGRYIEDKTLIYVCVNNTCKLPVNKVSDALKSIKNQ